MKAGGVIGPLFSTFGPDAVKDRLEDCEAKVLITTPKLVKVVYEIMDELLALETIIIVNRESTLYDYKEKEVSYESIMDDSSDEFDMEKPIKKIMP